jgi:ribonuclease HI
LDHSIIEIYTDGSCHTGHHIGAWAAILLIGNEKIVLKGKAQDTTHNRMELMAVIKAVEFMDENHKGSSLIVYTDSQYVHHIPERKDKLKKKQFLTNKGTPIQNVDLVQTLILQIERHSISFIKVKAHQKPNDSMNYNIVVDKIARELVRECVKQNELLR